METKKLEMYVFVGCDEEGVEGIVVCPIEFNGEMRLMPLVCTSAERAERMRPFAKLIALARRAPVRLLKFAVVEELAVIPAGGGILPEADSTQEERDDAFGA